MGSLPSFAAQCTNGRNANNQPFAAPVLDVSVTGLLPLTSTGETAAGSPKLTLIRQKLAIQSRALSMAFLGVLSFTVTV
mgnify:CR=1 FL=1